MSHGPLLSLSGNYRLIITVVLGLSELLEVQCHESRLEIAIFGEGTTRIGRDVLENRGWVND